MASEEKILQVGEAQETPQAITITIVDPSTLGSTSLDPSLVASVEAQGGADPGSIVMVSGGGDSKGILQTVTETHMGTEELPIISNISNPEEEDEEEEETIVHETKLSESFDGGGDEGELGESFEEAEEAVGPHCLVCNIDLTSNDVDEQVPVFKTQTSTTQRRVAVFLSGLIGQKLTSRKAHSDILCRRCFSLLDRVDSLEVEIRETKEEIVNKYQETVSSYGGRARRRKPATAKNPDYVFPKVEPEDEADQLLDMELDGNFEPQVEDLMDEDPSLQDDDWEPKFKRPRIKKESTSISETSDPPKRKRGRPRKDLSKSKMSSDDEGGPLAFNLVDDATSRGNTLLVDSRGYSYTRGKESPKGITWRCTIRNVKTYCKATVRQKGYMFIPGSVEHCHLAEQGALPMAKAFSRINKEIKARPLESPASVAKEVISTEFTPDTLDHIAKAKLIRRAHYHRRSLHPKSLSSVNVLVDEEPAPWTFEVVEDATKRGKPRLLDSRGYSYTQAKGTANAAVWRCTIRNDKVYCRATVRQSSLVFMCGSVEHCHPPEVGALSKAKFLSRLNREARAHPHESAASIVKRVLASDFASECPGSLKLANLIRSVNYQRRAARPKDPASLDFETNDSAIPEGFLKADIFIAGKRHLIFGTPAMLSLLSQARMWYCDLRFSLVSSPFQQLFSLHVFIKSGSTSKQVPMLFVLMSDRTKEDYVAVLLKILELLPAMPNVHTITMDFEMGLWTAVMDILPTARLYGSHYSWNQLVWHKISDLDLVASYHNSDSTQKFCRQLMALPFLPVTEIPGMFVEFTDSTEDSSQCYKDLVNFVRLMWLDSSLWPPSRWSVFKRPIRTKNDVDGWLKRVTHKSQKKSMGFYQLIALLFKESIFDENQISLVTDEELIKYQRAKFSRVQAKIFETWECFSKNELSPLDLLNHVAVFNGPDTSGE
ncbi:uncharacterized protein LOC135090589 isoform X6 [Scylla paramamosain]|uniref:uncharacterized protein LOC135090589 isoform X6 n=1 Tax=Scylla paramamosain TaxID=85552 RepID=UPI0030833455